VADFLKLTSSILALFKETTLLVDSCYQSEQRLKPAYIAEYYKHYSFHIRAFVGVYLTYQNHALLARIYFKYFALIPSSDHIREEETIQMLIIDQLMKNYPCQM